MSRTLPLTRWLLSSAVFAGMVLLCAGRTNVPMLTAYVAVFAGMGLAIALVTDLPQDSERRKPSPGAIDPGSRCLASVLFFSTVFIAALDAGRFHWGQAVCRTTQIVSLAVLTLAGALQVWAMVSNPFFSTAIRVQTDRGHELVTRGPYRYVRHPGYLAMIVMMPATALSIGSLTAMIPGSFYSALILLQMKREDKFLVQQLTGYAKYAERVRYRLIPGLW